MESISQEILDKIYRPGAGSHKGDNGRLLIIGGSSLFHGAALWPAEVASRIVDLVFFSSIPLNNKIYEQSKAKFQNGIVVPREDLDDYLGEADCVLIGPGMMRSDKFQNSNSKLQNIQQIIELEDEGELTYYLAKYVLEKYPKQKFVIDGGALQMMKPEWLENLKTSPILTPHYGEFERLKDKISSKAKATAGRQNAPIRQAQGKKVENEIQQLKVEQQAALFAKYYRCVVLLKGKEDVVSDGERTEVISGGNAGMTKGGTGDVLAGLVASLYTKSPAFESAVVGSHINKKAGERCAETMGNYYNASDLASAVPGVMKEILG